jgi:hypothetical protein
VSQCLYELVCPFFQHQIPIHEAMYQTNVTRYCDGVNENCAIHQVMQKACFLNVPKDLYPNQTFRVADILKPSG